MTYPDRITVLGPSATSTLDPYGNAVPGPPSRQESPAQVDPARTLEDNTGRDASLAYYDVLAPAGLVVTHAGQVEWRGGSYEVDGAPLLHGAGTSYAEITFTIKQVRE